MLDKSQYWAFPGLHYFEDDPVDRALFFGREKEIQQLTERIIAEDLTVLFGKSGDGKTSLINAGLKWAFRELGYLPVRARIFHLPEQTPLAALYQAIAGEAKLNDVTLPPDWQRKTLWESFLALRPTEKNRLKPIVLILDQFEELFTLMAGRWEEQEDFIAQLADLVRGRLPETVREKYRRQLATLPAASDEARKLEQLLYGSASPTVRILLSLREDYLAFLNNLGRRIPKVFASRYRLSSLTIEQARLAIANPPQQEVLGAQKFRIEDDAVAALLDFLTQQSSRSGVSEEIIGPPQLQVLCSQLEEQMREKDKSSISVSDLGGDAGMRKLLSRYYRGILEKFPSMRLGRGPRQVPGIWGMLRRLQPVHSPRFAVRCLCEERLITAGGNRNSRHEDEIIREIGVAPADLQELVESRLLRREPRLQESFYELSHDSLVPSLQVAGGMRQAWVTGVKVVMIAAIVFIVTQWGLPYVQRFYEVRSLAAEFEAVKKGQVDAGYFRTRLAQVRLTSRNSKKLEEIDDEFNDWRMESLRDAFLKADLSQADSLLQHVLRKEYPFADDLLMALADTLRERQIRQIQQRYQRLLDQPVDLQEAYAKADALLDSAFSAFPGNIRITELQKKLARRRGDVGEQEKLARIIETQQDIASKALLGAIQIAEPKNMIVKGDSSGKASSFELVLEYNPLLANATVLLNGKRMSGAEILSSKENKLQSSPRQKAMPTRTGKFLSGIVPIPAGAREVQVKITVKNSDGVEVSRDFVFTIDREPPRMKSFKILYKDTEKEEWKNMPQNEWRGNFWRIEVEPSEPLQAASANITYATIAGNAVAGKSAVGESEIVFTATLSSNWREVAIEGTSKDFSSQDEISCLLKMQDLAGWQSSFSLGKWKIAIAPAVQAPAEIKPTVQLPLKLRSIPDENLTSDEVRNMIKKYDFYCKEYDWTKAWSNPNGKGVAHDFIPQQNGQVILDRATGLMWQQSGSTEYMTFERAQKYIEELDRRKFAGYSDWRLPTLEEAMSLMEPTPNRNFYIDTKFDDKQPGIWTSDISSAGWVWFVYFSYGSCVHVDIGINLSVRAVRSGQ